ncbi:MAG: hypothetical protein NXY57DRAFT_968885 [Lentinula lateritia]|nr:MAG: hypothetical protein NXY57DRAFT_968885 [Lentinula lateritia]
MPDCVTACQKSFSSSISLQQHQRICKHYASDFETAAAARLTKCGSKGQVGRESLNTPGPSKKRKIVSVNFLKKSKAIEPELPVQNSGCEQPGSISLPVLQAPLSPPLLSPSPPPVPLPLLNRAGRPMRSAAIPAPTRDVLPQGPPAVLVHALVDEFNQPTRIRRVILIVRDTVKIMHTV